MNALTSCRGHQHFQCSCSGVEMQTAGRWILRNTRICIDHMTPEIKLRLITAECPMWTQQPESCPYPDPYWAFYWPGGQTLTRFILDRKNLVEGKVCLDFGSGCGSAGIASAMTGAKKVIFNDIDQSERLHAMFFVPF